MFSVAKQTVTDPVSGLSLSFDTDPSDYAVVQCTVTMKDAKDHLDLVFARNGSLISMKMVDAEAEEDARLRAEAAARQDNYLDPAADKKASEDAAKAAAEQAEKDKALLASEPKISKYEKPAEGKTEELPPPGEGVYKPKSKSEVAA